MDYFIKSQTFSAQWPFIYAGKNLYFRKTRKLLLITNINHNLGKCVLEGTVSEPKCLFNSDRIKYCNIYKLLKKFQMNRNENIQRNKNYKSFSKKLKMNTKK